MINQIKYQSNFKKIVAVDILHDFFNDSMCSSFEITPDADSATTMKNYGVLFKKTKCGFVLISSGEERFKSETFNGEVSLSFSMRSTDPFFYNYTDLPTDREIGFYFENIHETNRLHKNEFVDGTAIASHQKLFGGEIKLNLNKENQFFGVPETPIEHEEERYTISFRSRKIFIRYNFYTNNQDFVFTDLYITDEDQSFKFNNIEKRVLANNREAHCITRDHPIEMKQFLQEKLFLKKEDRFFNSFSIQLPQPEIKNIAFNPEKNIFFGEVFISID